MVTVEKQRGGSCGVGVAWTHLDSSGERGGLSFRGVARLDAGDYAEFPIPGTNLREFESRYLSAFWPCTAVILHGDAKAEVSKPRKMRNIPGEIVVRDSLR